MVLIALFYHEVWNCALLAASWRSTAGMVAPCPAAPRLPHSGISLEGKFLVAFTKSWQHWEVRELQLRSSITMHQSSAH